MLHSYAAGSTATPLLDETITQRLRKTAEQYPEAEAIVAREQRFRVTYGELFEMVEQAARSLVTIGVEPGDRVGILAPNRFEWLVVQYAAAAASGILVPVSPYGRGPEIKHVLRNAGVRVLIHAAEFRETDLSALVASVRDDCPDLLQVVDIDREWPDFMWRSHPAAAAECVRREYSVKPGDPAAILHTSGTTGSPKGVTLSHHSIVNNAFAVGRLLRYGASDRVCIPVPFFHCFGMVLGSLACTAHGACMVIPSAAYDVTSVLAAIAAEHCTAIYGVPTMYVRTMSHPEFDRYDLSSLRTGIMGGAACPSDLVRRVTEEMGVSGLTISYGMTETSPISIQTSPDDSFEVRATTVGNVMPHVEAQIVDPVDGTVLPQGSEGELCVRGYSVMLGYWNDPGASQAVIDDEGWMHTGDLAIMAEDHRFRYTGRVKDMIIVGGENVSPVEVENYLCTHPEVDEVQVIGIPDLQYGERVMAWVRLRGRANVGIAELTNFCRMSLAGSKVPTRWKFVDEFPLTANGKVRKAAMREESIRELGVDS